MVIVCTNCQTELAEVTVLASFNAPIQCGTCSAIVGHKFDPEPEPEAAVVDPPKVPPASKTASQ
jgi:hypothetical protein